MHGQHMLQHMPVQRRTLRTRYAALLVAVCLKGTVLQVLRLSSEQLIQWIGWRAYLQHITSGLMSHRALQSDRQPMLH